MENDEPKPWQAWLARMQAHRGLRLLGSLAVAAVGIYALYVMAGHVTWSEVKADLQAVPGSVLAWAILAATLSFASLGAYDVLSVNSMAPKRVPSWVSLLTGASGYAISNLLGASWLTGTAVRYRIYGRRGLDFAQVLAVLAVSWSAFWMASLLILGALMVLHPAGLAAVLPLSGRAELGLGLAILLVLGGFLLWIGRGARGFRLAGKTYNLPSLQLALALIAVAVADLIFASATLYILMPATVTTSYAVLFVVFIAALTLGIISHTPAGVGVFEATIILGLGAVGRSDVLAGLVLFRLVYTVLPFVVAGLGLAVVWLVQHFRPAPKG